MEVCMSKKSKLAKGLASIGLSFGILFGSNACAKGEAKLPYKDYSSSTTQTQSVGQNNEMDTLTKDVNKLKVDLAVETTFNNGAVMLRDGSRSQYTYSPTTHTYVTQNFGNNAGYKIIYNNILFDSTDEENVEYITDYSTSEDAIVDLIKNKLQGSGSIKIKKEGSQDLVTITNLDGNINLNINSSNNFIASIQFTHKGKQFDLSISPLSQTAFNKGLARAIASNMAANNYFNLLEQVNEMFSKYVHAHYVDNYDAEADYYVSTNSTAASSIDGTRTRNAYLFVPTTGDCRAYRQDENGTYTFESVSKDGYNSRELKESFKYSITTNLSKIVYDENEGNYHLTTSDGKSQSAIIVRKNADGSYLYKCDNTYLGKYDGSFAVTINNITKEEFNQHFKEIADIVTSIEETLNTSASI